MADDILQGGVQLVASIAPQIVYLDFDGELTRYNGEFLTIDNVEVQHSLLTKERIENILYLLNEKYASQNVKFVTELPASGEYSTIYIGKTSAFDAYGTFAGLAETIDYNNAHKSDNAFVNLDSSATDLEVVNTIAHETDHLLGTLDHGGSGLAAYAMEHIISSGVISTSAVLLNDSMYIFSGGTASGTTVNSMGKMVISSGGTATFTCINSAGSMIIEGGAVASGILVNYSGSLSLLSGGVAFNGFVNGNLNVYSGGMFDRLKIVDDAAVLIADGAKVFNIDWTPCVGKLYIENAEFSFASAYSGCYFGWYNTLISKNLTMTSNVIGQNISMYVMNNGEAFYTYVTSRGEVCVFDGGRMVDTVLGNGFINIYNGGMIRNVELNSGGIITVFQSGSVQSANINANGVIVINSGGVAENTVVNSNGHVTVADGGNLYGTTVNSGGNVSFAQGGTAENTVINEQGCLYINEGVVINDTTINSGGTLHIFSNGTADKLCINSGGNVYVSSGGTATNVIWTPCIGDIYVADGAEVTYADKYSGVYSGAFHMTSAQGMHVGDKMYVMSGGIATSTTVCSGRLYVCSQGMANDTTLNHSGGLFVSYGGIANFTNVNSHACLYVYNGGAAHSSIINSSGYVHVSSGGFADSIKINSQGFLYVYSGGTATDIVWTPCVGSIYIEDGAYVSYNSSHTGVYLGSRNKLLRHTECASGDVISGTFDVQTMYVMSAGIIKNTTVKNNGYVYVYGGCAENTRIDFSGVLEVRQGTASCTNMSDWGYIYASSGGMIKDTVMSAGQMNVYFSGGANQTSVISGRINVYSGGTANNTVIQSGGRMNISSGGSHRGRLNIMQGAVVSAHSGSIIDFTVAGWTGDSGYLINDLSLISGTPTYTITVDSDQDFGIYKLARGAENFTGSITIGDRFSDYVSITVNGNELIHNGTAYSLEEAGGDLTLRVKAVTISNLLGHSNGLSWDAIPGVQGYIVEYSTDNFVHAVSFETISNKVDSVALPSGTYQWRVKAVDGNTASNGENIISQQTVTGPQEFVSNADGNTDIFFINANEKWTSGYAAQHTGFLNGWSGTNEQVTLTGKNKLADIFEGSTDANILLMTDDANGDTLFLDDIYSIFGNQARIAKINETRAGAGDDVIDMTSQRFAYSGDGMTIYGGLGDDTIWANNCNNTLFGDAGNDRIVGGAKNDIIIGGSGNDSMHGGGGDDVFCFGSNWGNDTIEQLSGGSVTLWFERGSVSNWNASTLTYSDGINSIQVSGVDNVTLKFGDVDTAVAGAFLGAASEKIFEDRNSGMIA